MDFSNSAITVSNPSSSESLRESSLAEAEGVDSAFGLGSFLIGVLIVSFCFAPSFSSFLPSPLVVWRQFVSLTTASEVAMKGPPYRVCLEAAP